MTLLLPVMLFGCSNTQAVELTLKNTPTQIYFSPHGGCTDSIVKEISKAKSEILVQAYSFTSKEIAKALVDAHKRGIHVERSIKRILRDIRGGDRGMIAIVRTPAPRKDVLSILFGSPAM